MQRLLVAVIQRIFVQCISSNQFPLLHRSAAPILLEHICGRWRTIALEMPFLWFTVHFAAPNYDPVHPMTASQVLLRCEAMKTCLGLVHCHWRSRYVSRGMGSTLIYPYQHHYLKFWLLILAAGRLEAPPAASAI